MSAASMRIRQIALVARELDPVVDDLCAVLGVEVAFNDPGVGEFGLTNAVMALGDQFLEVVCPVRADATAARHLERRRGDGGYMVILQSADLDADRARLARVGVRIVWEIAFDDIATIHLHPRDIGGAIVSLDRPIPPASWRWGGASWEEKGRRSQARAIVGAEIQSDDPHALATRWSDVLGVRVQRHDHALSRIDLDGGHLRFVAPGDDRGPGVSCVRIAMRDLDDAVRRARTRGLVDAHHRVAIGGVRLDLVAAP
ncbi:VOC family protein [Candidatus Binatia bacterium]|nr:VOC family protein [Candidatus Binatia bacterium]